MTVDLFLRTLADTQRERAVGVVLSGMGSDGTAGLAAIRAAGGVTIAQVPADAQESSMPRSAIEAGVADFVLTAAQIPARLVELRDTGAALRARAGAGSDDAEIDPSDAGADPQQALTEMLAVLLRETGHDFTPYRQPTLLRRLERRLQVRGLPDLPAYLQLLHRDASEPAALLKELLIGVTSFFRDPDAFAVLDQRVLPALFEGRPPQEQLRAWVAPCATGEEAYTIAMLLAGQAARQSPAPAVQVFASDIDESALQIARAGRYLPTIADDVPLGLLQYWFTFDGAYHQVRKGLRERVLFARQNLLHDPAFSRLDLISCRNFLIYLNREAHRHILQTFHFALKPGGYLLLGNAESADAAPDLFVAVDAGQRIYRATPAPRAQRSMAAIQTILTPASVPPRYHPPDASRRSRQVSYADIHRQRALAFGPPSLLLDGAHRIVHATERAAAYLRQVGGEPTSDALAVVLPALQLPLRAALLRTQQGERAAATGPVRYDRAGTTCAVDIRVLPFDDEQAGDELLLVEFREVPDVQQPQSISAGSPDAALVRQLEHELAQARLALQQTVDRADLAGSEMHAYSEGLLTTVDELRAATDALLEDRETLQSANLELAAINGELQARIEATARAHDDLVNLIASSDVATVFLDRAMRIERYTPRFADIFNVIPADVGRALTDITDQLDVRGLADEAARVFDTLQPLEREVRTRDGRVYLVRAHPYRTADDSIDGAVLSLFDITLRQHSEQALRDSEARLAALFESLPVAVGVFDRAGTLVHANQQMFRYLPNGILPSRDSEHPQRWQAHLPDGTPAGRSEFPGIRALHGERVVPGMEMRYTQDDGREIWTQVSAVPVHDAQGRVTGEVAVITNIDILKRTEIMLRENEARLHALAQEFARIVWEAAGDGRFVVDSPSWRAATGQAREAWLAGRWLEAVHPDDRADAARRWQGALADRHVFTADYRLANGSGGWLRTRARAIPLIDVDGTVRKWVGMNIEV